LPALQFVEEFSIEIPWTTIFGYGDIKVGIKGLYAVVEPTAAQAYDAAQEAAILQAVKDLQIQKIEHAARQFKRLKTGSNPEQELSLWDSLKTYAIEHLKVNITDVHIVYKDTITVVDSPFLLGLSLDNIVMDTEKSSPSHGSQVNKTLHLNSMAIYWNSKVDSTELTWQYLKDNIARAGTPRQSNSYILDPVSATAKMVINHDSVARPKGPKILATIELDDLTLELSSRQFHDITKLYKTWDRMKINSVYRKYQPRTRLPCQSPGHIIQQWWQYAITSVIEVQIKPSKWYTHKMLQHWRWFKEYLDCYEQKLKHPNLSPNTIQKLKDLETKLGAVAICLARAEAERQTKQSGNVKTQKETQGYFSWTIQKVSSWLGYDHGNESGTVESASSGHSGSSLDDFLDQMSPDERTRFYNSIGHSSHAVLSLKPKEYVKTAINLSVHRLQLVLSGQSGKISTLAFHDIKMLSDQRPSAEAIRIKAEVAGLELWGKDAGSSQPRLIQMVTDQTTQDIRNNSPKFFHFRFETNPLKQDADFLVKAYLHPVDWKLDPPTIAEVGKFLTVEDPNYVSVLWSFAEQKLEEFRRSATENLIYSLENQKILLLDLDLKSPTFILPESGKSTGEEAAIVIDLGHLSVTQKRDRQESLRDGLHVTPKSMDGAFIQYDVQLARVRVLVAEHNEDWKKASSDDISPLDLLYPTEWDIKVMQSMQSDNPVLPSLKIQSTLPSTEIQVSDKQLSVVGRVLHSLPFDQDQRPQQVKNVETIPKNTHQLIYSPTEEDIVAVAEVSTYTESEILSADDVLSFYSAEDGLPDHYDEPDSPSVFKGQSLIQIDMRFNELKMDVHQLHSNGNLEDYLSAKFGQLNFEADFRHDSWEAEVTLSYASVIDKKRQNQDGNDLELLHTNSTKVVVAWMDKTSPHFKKLPHCGQWEWTLFIILNNLKIKADQDAFFEIRDVFQRCLMVAQSPTPTSGSMSFSEFDVEKESDSTAEENDSSVSWHATAKLENLCISIIEKDQHQFAVLDVHELSATTSVNESSTEIKANLQNLTVDDTHSQVSSKRMISLAESVNGVFYVHLKLSQATKLSPHLMFGNSLSAEVGRLRVVYLHSFFNQVYLWASRFTYARAQLAKTTETVTKNAQKTVVKLQESGSSIKVNITVDAPLVCFPESVQSPNALLLNMGKFNIKNSLTNFQSAHVSSMPSPLLKQEQSKVSSIEVEHYHLHFEELSLVRVIRHIRGRRRTQRKLLHQLKFDLDATRNLTIGSQDQSVPLVDIWGKIPGLHLSINEDDYHSVMKIYQTNLGGSSIPEDAELEQATSTSTDTVDLPSRASKTVTLRLAVQSIRLELFTNHGEIHASSMRKGQYGINFALFEMNHIHLNGEVLGDGAKKMTLSISEVMLSDSRPNRPDAIHHILTHGKELTSVPAITVRYEQEANQGQIISLDLERPHVCLCMKFLLRLQKFLFESSNNETNIETTDNGESNKPRMSHLSRDFTRSVRRVAAQLVTVQPTSNQSLDKDVDTDKVETTENDAIKTDRLRRGQISRRFASSMRRVAAQLVAVQPAISQSQLSPVLHEEDMNGDDAVDGPVYSRAESPSEGNTAVSSNKLSLELNCKRGHLVVPETAKDHKSPALIVHANVTITAFKETGQTRIAASFQDLDMVSCILSQPSETKVPVLRPCKAELEGVFTAGEDLLLLRLHQLEITLYHSVLKTMNSLLQSYQKSSNQVEQDPEITMQAGDQLLVPQDVNRQRWKTTHVENATPISQSDKEQQLIVDAGDISVTLQVKHTEVYRPVVVLCSSVKAELLNWSHYPTAGADVQLQASYYNTKLDAWEPLIETIESTTGEYQMWNMSVRLIQLIDQPAVYSKDIKFEDELIQRALSQPGNEFNPAELPEVHSPGFSMGSRSPSLSSFTSGLKQVKLAPRRSVSHVSGIMNFNDQVSSDETDAVTSHTSGLTFHEGVTCNCIILTSPEPLQLIASTASLSALKMAYEAWNSDKNHPRRQSLFHPSMDEVVIHVENTVGLKTSLIFKADSLESSVFDVESDACRSLIYSCEDGKQTLKPVGNDRNSVCQSADFRLSGYPEHPHGSDIDESESESESDSSVDQVQQASVEDVPDSGSFVVTSSDTHPISHSSRLESDLEDTSIGPYDLFKEYDSILKDDEITDDESDEPDTPAVRTYVDASLLRQFSTTFSIRSHHDVRHTLEVKQLLSIQFENSDHMTNVPLSKSCTTLVPVGNAEGDQQGFAVCEVVCKPHEKTIKIRSPLQIENHLPEQLEILCQMPDDSSDGYTHILTVDSCKTISVPLHIAHNGNMYLKPTGYKKGEQCLKWKPGLHQEGSFLEFASDAGDLAPINVQISWKSSFCGYGFEGENSTTTMMHIHPPVVIANLLPLDMSYRLQDEGGEYQWLKKGSEQPLVRLARVMEEQIVHVRIVGYQDQREWVGAFEFSSNSATNDVLPLKVSCVTDSGKRMKMHLGIHVVKEVGIRLSVFCPYWILNKTTLPLTFKGKKGFHQRSTGQAEDILLLTFGRLASHKLKFTLENCSCWSSSFAVNAVGNVDVVTCHCDGTVYEVQIKIEMSYTSLTKVITLTPRYVIHNKSEYTLECSGPPQENWLVLEPTQCGPFWPTETKQMRIRLAQSVLQSWPFGFHETESFLLLLRGSSNEPVNVISVNIREEGVSKIIVFGPYYPGAAPVRLDNFLSQATIEFHQANSGQMHILHPGKSMLYTWDEPLNPKYICWKAVGSEEDMTKTYCIDGKGEFVIPLKRRTTFLAAEQALAAAASSLLPATVVESDDETKSEGEAFEPDSVEYDTERYDDKPTADKDETDFFKKRQPKPLFHPVGHWVSFLDGSQRTLLFTTDPNILRQATQVEQQDRAYTDLFISFSIVSISVLDRQPQEIAHITLLETSNWEILPRVDTSSTTEEWQPLNVHLSNLVEELYEEKLQQQQDTSLPLHKKEAEVLFSNERNEMIKPVPGKLRRAVNPGLWYRLALSNSRSVNLVRLGKIQIDNQMFGAQYSVALSELPPHPSDRPVGTMFEIAWMSQQINPSCPVQYKVRASVEPLETSLDLGFVFSFWRVIQPQAEDDKTEMDEIQQDLESIGQLEWKTATLEGSGARESLVEYLYVDPAEVKLNLSLSKGHASLKEDASKLDKFQLFIGSLGFSLPSFEDVDLHLDSLQRIGGTMDTNECWSLVMSHYQHQALSQAYKAILGLDVGTSSFQGFFQDMKSFSNPLADFTLHDSRQGFKEDLALGVRSVVGHVSGGAASLVGKTATSIGHRLAALTFDKKFQQVRH
jgi:vacuolar protein sorting-associated protein 13A/C